MSVSGVAELHRALVKDIPEAVYEELFYAIGQEAQDMVQMMKSLVPARTGRLRDSVETKWSLKSKKSAGYVKAIIFGGNDSTTIVRGRRKFQLARIVEFGTKKKPARPFFFPVWRLKKKKARARMNAAVKKAIQGYASASASTAASAGQDIAA